MDDEHLQATAMSVAARISHHHFQAAAEKLTAGVDSDERLFECLFVVAGAAAGLARAHACRHAPLPADTPIGARMFQMIDGHLVDKPIDDTEPGMRAAIRFFNAAGNGDLRSAMAVALTVRNAIRAEGSDTIRPFLNALFSMLAGIMPPHPGGPTGADR